MDCHRVFKTSTYEDFKNINPDRVDGTCKWVTEHPQYQQWRHSHQDDLLWISADPGCGKSVLSKPLVEHELRSTTTHSTCYFFFKDNEDQNDLATALCALLHQLFTSQPMLLRSAMGAYQKNGEQLQNETGELWRTLVAAATDEHAHSVTCIIDALDECRRDDFAQAHRASNDLLYSIRPYQNIEFGFRDIPPQLPSIRLAGEQSNAGISEEIDLVIKEKVAQAGRKLQYTTTDPYALGTSFSLSQNIFATPASFRQEKPLLLRCSRRPAHVALLTSPCSRRPAHVALLTSPCSRRPAHVALLVQHCQAVDMVYLHRVQLIAEDSCAFSQFGFKRTLHPLQLLFTCIITRQSSASFLKKQVPSKGNASSVADSVRVLDYETIALINQRARRMPISRYLDEVRRSDKPKANLLNRDASDLRQDESKSNSLVAA